MIFGIALLGVIGYLAYDSGMFDDLTNMIPDISGVSLQPPTQSMTGIAAQYPTPEAAKAAVDSGAVSITAFPPEMRNLINSVETPKVEP